MSEAQILRGKYFVEEFEPSPHWAGPYHGLDYGFGGDPSAAVRCHIDDETRTLYVSAEYWRLGAEIDALAGELETAIPGICRHVVFADSARPESTSFLQRNGVTNIRSVEKWPGSVDDGIAYLRAFSRIVIHPSCTHLLDECQRYAFMCDRLTGLPRPEVVDRHNHLIDALRYALSPLIRNQPVGGYFSRGALLVDGEPVEPQPADRPRRVFATLAVCDRPGTAVAVVYFASAHLTGPPLRVLGYELAEVSEVQVVDWLRAVFERAHTFRREWGALESSTRLWVEDPQLLEALTQPLMAYVQSLPGLGTGGRPPVDIIRVPTERLPVGLDERAASLRSMMNAGGLLKVGRGAYSQQSTHRSVRANHLLAQVLGYRPAALDSAQELVAALLLGCLIGRVAERTLPPPAPVEEPAPAPPVRKLPRPMWMPALLARGKHQLQHPGGRVEHIELDAAGYWDPPAHGRYVIDGKQHWASPVAAAIPIQLGAGK